ncbi:MAG: RNA methyltransferase, partial [Bacteroidota bacterium]
AAWFGVDAVLADADSADFEGPKSVRASMGGLWDVHLSRTDDLSAALDALLARGLSLWGARAASGDSAPLAEWAPGAQSVLVMGSEAHGLSEASRQRLTGGVWIPGGDERRGVESLNVSVAAGILMHAWTSA